MKYFFKQLLKVPMLWVFAFMIAIFGFAALGKRAEVNTFAVVTAVGIDRTQEEDNAYEVSLLTFIPVAEQTFAESYKVVSAKGRSVAEAMDFAGLFLGRQVGLSHLNIVVLNQALFDDDVSIYLDYLSRNKHVSSSTKLVATDKTAKEFLQAAQKLDTESSIKVGDLISFNSEYIYAADTSFETFFKGTFCPTRVGMMSLLSTGQTSKGQISSNPNSGETAKGEQSSGGEKGAAGSGSQGAEAEQTGTSIESAEQSSSSGQESSATGQQSSSGGQSTGSGSSSSSGGGSGSATGQEVVNDGSTFLFKDGKMKLFLSGKDMKKINIMRGNFSTGSIEIKNFTDNDFTNANLTFEIFERDIGFKVNYENGVPIVHINLGLTLRLSEVEDEKGPIKENIEFFVVSEDALKAVEKKAKTVMAEGLEIMRENQLDVADFYTILSNAGRAKFLKFLDGLEDKEDYLNHIVFKAAVDVSTK